MTFSKQLFPLLFFFHFPLRYASTPEKCSSSFSNPHRCGPLEVPIHFPFCDNPDFNLHCNDLNKTVLELPMSGTFLVQDINYIKQQIYINDPENCLPKRLLAFNVSGSPFSSRFNTSYTFFTCSNEVVLPSWNMSVSIPCLSNSSSTYFATTSSDLPESMLPSCQIVKRLHLPELSRHVNNGSLMLEWDLPDCKLCAMSFMRCAFENKASLEIQCFNDKKSGHLSTAMIVIITSLSITAVATGFTCFISRRKSNSHQRLVSPPQPQL